MFTRIYVEALLVDEELADQVWEAWDADELSHADGVFAPYNGFAPGIDTISGRMTLSWTVPTMAEHSAC